MKDMYAALSELSIYINSDFKHDVCECCVCDIINLSDDCEHVIN